MNMENISERSVARRTLVKGAAWSLPVIAAAVAVPAYASSVFACPTFTRHDFVVTKGNLKPNTGATGWNTETVFSSQQDNNSTSAGTANQLTLVIPVIAGKTYTFTTQFGSRWGIPGSSSAGQVALLLINNVEKWRGSTRNGALNPGQNNVTAHATGTASYTATANGTITFSVYLWLDPRGGASVNDDIDVVLPTLTCS